MKSPTLTCAILAALLITAATGAFAQEFEVSPIASIKALSEKDASDALSVRVQGIVTYIAPNGQFIILQDETGGICINGPRERPTKVDIKVGATAEIEGVTGSSGGFNYITARKKELIKILSVSDGVLPEPRPATMAQLQQGAFQCVRVEVEGVVRSIRTEPFVTGYSESLLITLGDQHRRVTVSQAAWRGSVLPTNLIGSTVRVRGIFLGIPMERQMQFLNRLMVIGLKDLQAQDAVRPAYERPLMSVQSAREQADNPGEAECVHMAGTVTVPVQGKGFYVEDEFSALFVESATAPDPGDHVEIAGFPAMREGAPVLEDTMWRVATHAIPVTPPLVTAEAAASGSLDGRLVQIEALLLAVSAAGDGQTLVLQTGERVFLARTASPSVRLSSLGENSWLRVTGVCVNTRTSHIRDSAVARPASFHLLLASPQSVEIATTPSWWTLRRIMIGAGGLVCLTFAAVVWATTLRRRVAEQTAQIREHLAREAVAEERLRIARELHDSVQQDLLGITMQIKATDRLLEVDPEKARSALTLASAMVRRSQTETHRAVWDLRAGASQQEDIASALAEILERLKTEDGAHIELTCVGNRRSVPATTEGQILRVAQEAVTNALKHAQASRIEVELQFAVDRVTLVVRDDGRGFDADHPPSAATGHFGLFGMRERAIKLEADLRITSRTGAGTAVQLGVPLEPEPPVADLPKIPTALRLVPRPSTS